MSSNKTDDTSDKYRLFYGGSTDDDDDAPPPVKKMAVRKMPIFRRTKTPKESVYESLDYDVCENQLWEQEFRAREKFVIGRKDIARWVVIVLIGIMTALVACFVDIVIEELSFIKYNFLKASVDENVLRGDLYMPYLFWMLTNAVPVLISSALVTYIEPVAGGSGIPQVKCYLNGVKIPRIVRIKTLVVKVFGVILSVVGGLPGGKEGPMIHSGAIIGAGISQGKSTTFNRDFKILGYFRDDHEKRDFVVNGAAAGVSAAFGAPFGGVLFALEEAASFWNVHLLWRTIVASIISSFTLNVVLSAYHGTQSFTFPGLFNLGEFEPLPYKYYELPIFTMMGVVGGLFGALWNAANTKLNLFRKRFLKPKWAKVFEAIFLSITTASLACVMIYCINDCRPLGNDPTTAPVQLFCEDYEYNAVAALWFQTPEASVKSLFHDPPGSHKILTLAVFVLIYFILSCFTFGMSISLGIFIPTLLVGAAWGRLTAIFLSMIFPTTTFFHPGKYALIGAAAQLGGVLRMTISLTLILIESTGNISFALPLIITLITAKAVGDLFNAGIYDIQIRVSEVPMLAWSAPDEYKKLKAPQVMSPHVVCVFRREKVEYVLHLLENYSYNAFPVVEESGLIRAESPIIGLIHRYQMIIILKKALYTEKEAFWRDDVTIETFRNEYPRYPSLKNIKINESQKKYTIDFEMFMNPSPYTVCQKTSVPRVFQLFRALGLRHVIVVDGKNCAVGMITRKDLI